MLLEPITSEQAVYIIVALLVCRLLQALIDQLTNLGVQEQFQAFAVECKRYIFHALDLLFVDFKLFDSEHLKLLLDVC